MAETIKLMRMQLRLAQTREQELEEEVADLRGEALGAQDELAQLRGELAQRSAEAGDTARRAAEIDSQFTSLCVQLATQPCGRCEAHCNPGPLIDMLVRRGAWDALYLALDRTSALCSCPEVQLRRVEAAVRTGRRGDAERLTREGPVDDPEGMLCALTSLPLESVWPVMNVAHRFNLMRPAIRLLHARGALCVLEEYLCGRGGATNFPQVLSALAELGESARIETLAAKVAGSVPLAATVAAAEEGGLLPLLQSWLEERVAAGCDEPAVYTALAKVYSDSRPERLLDVLQRHAACVNAREVGDHCARNNARLAMIAYAAGKCDAELLALGMKRGMVTEVVEYLTRRGSADLWAAALESAEHADMRAELVSAGVQRILLTTQNKAQFAVAARTLVACGVDAVQGRALAQQAVLYGLYEEAFEACRCTGDCVNAMGVLLRHIGCLVTAHDYATQVQRPEVWRMLGEALEKKGMTDDAVVCFTHAGDHSAVTALRSNEDGTGAVRSTGGFLSRCARPQDGGAVSGEAAESAADGSGEEEGAPEFSEGAEEDEEEEEDEGDDMADDEVDQIIDDLPVALQYNVLRPGMVQVEDRLLAAGGFGEVKRGRLLGAAVAVKEPKRPDDDLEDEMLVLSQLHHPNIVHFIGVLCSRTPAIVTEYCAVGSLGRVIRLHALRARTGASCEVLSWSMKASWLRDIGRALRYMHSKSFLHRDLKSTNVLVAATSPSSPPSEWVMKLADMGLVCRSDDVALGEYLVGTRGFHAPEVLRDYAYSEASDAYGLGCVCVEVLCCRVPFAGAPASVANRIAAGKANAMLPSTVGGVRVPGQLGGIVLCMLVPDPQSRRRVDTFVDTIERDMSENESDYASAAPAEALSHEAVQYGWLDNGGPRHRRLKGKKKRGFWARWLLRKAGKQRRKRADARRAAGAAGSSDTE
eukprot:TRINITY_DN33674_c0_g1_i1.p1 TRINITY_DN33674_c0_g1~~TRINITY_DN33674_c0_g1_i1.p1  ORF type:complete len:1025 (+),score=249.03 TRINITY_DN33674_c0_g1_i1:288-3077(+)